jgi:hypothetical protein
MLASRIGVDQNAVGRRVLDRAVRALLRSEAAGLKAHLVESAVLFPVLGLDGSVLGLAPGFTIDDARIVRSLEHMVRGLYFWLTRTPMPSRLVFSANLNLDTDTDTAREIHQILAGRPVFELGDAFRCTFVETAEIPFFTAWLVEFYGTEQFAVFSIDPENPPGRYSLAR